jgi:hypothetical protein
VKIRFVKVANPFVSRATGSSAAFWIVADHQIRHEDHL